MAFVIYETQYLIDQVQRDNNLRRAIDNLKNRFNGCSDAHEIHERLNSNRDNRLTNNIWKKKILDTFCLII